MRFAGFLVAVALVSSAGAAPRAGKVVRIERAPVGITGTPRFCTVQPADMFGSCQGTKAPEVGDRMVAIDANRVIGMLRITQVQPYPDACQQVSNWMIQTVAESGDFSSARNFMIAMSDVPVDTRGARMITVDRTPTGHPWGTDTIYAIDGNGDGTPEVEFIQYGCDDFGNTSINPTSACFDVWAAQAGRGMERLRQDRVRVCY